jgi:uncharacterized protein (TIGR00369 family)
MTFYVEDGRVCSDVVLGPGLAGWQSIVHRGVVATLLDQVIAWAVLWFVGSFCVTREITVRYRRPVTVATPVTARAELVGDQRRHACRARAEVVDSAGNVLAAAEGDFALLEGEQLELLPEHLRAEAQGFVEKLRAARP